MTVPQLIVSLSPQGQLQLELPGAMATRRVIAIGTAEAGETLLRILQAQAQGQSQDAIGEASAPTRVQVEHWEDHQIWPKATCQFCIAEGRVGGDTSARRAARAVVLKRSDGVEVRRVPEKFKGVKEPQVAKGPVEGTGL